MKISSSMVDLYAASRSREKITYEETQLLPERQPAIPEEPENRFSDWATSSSQLNALKKTDQVDEKIYEISEEDYQKIKLLEKILSALTGKKVQFVLPKGIRAKGDGRRAHGQGGQGEQNVSAPKVMAMVPYKRVNVTYEHKQSMDFKASGQVTTEDGRTIDFDMRVLSKSQTSIQREEVYSKLQEVTDPLAITYDGSMPALTKDKYAFDLDFDGTSDQVSFLTKGSGFLSLDLNENGQIDDGRELFGPSSGNGFGELSAYDGDDNGWIDENDAVFDKLRIWEKDEQGNDVLLALGEVGIGAIYLGHVATDYVLGGSPLSMDGRVSGTGIFLKESGQAGMVSHIDLAL